MLGQGGELSARLAAATKMLADEGSVEPVVVAIGRALLFLTKAEHAAILLRSPNGLVTCPWSHNLSDAYVRDIVTPKGANPWMHILSHRELSCMDLPANRQTSSRPWFLPDALALSPDHAHLVDRITREGLRSMCAWPLAHAGRVTGALVYYYDSPHVYLQNEQEVMSAFGVQAAAALRDHGASLSQAESTMNATGTRRTPTEPPRLPLADKRLATERQQARAGIQAAPAQPNDVRRRPEAEPRSMAGRTSLETDSRRFAQTWAALAAERLADARPAPTLEADQLVEARRTVEAKHARPAETQARLTAAEAQLRQVDAAAAEAQQAGPTAGRDKGEAEPSRWRRGALAASAVIAAVAIAVLRIGPERHSAAVPTMEHKPAVPVPGTVVQKPPVSTPHQAIVAGVVRSVAKAGVLPTAPQDQRPRKAAYVVIVGTFENAKAAEEVKRLVQRKGFVVHIVLQGRVSQVMTAPMRTRAQAESVARGLEAVGLHPQLKAW